MKRYLILTLVCCGIAAAGMYSCSTQPGKTSADAEEIWPEITSSMKPWTRWWWMGNAVDRENITRRMEEFAQAGIGGVEITPIYGVKGFEEQFINHLSAEWMEMLMHTLDEAERLDMGVDMVLGTGWPFGGPQVEPEFAASKLYIREYVLKSGAKLEQEIILQGSDKPESAFLQYLYGFDADGQKKDLLSLVENRKLEWIPDYDCVVYALFLAKTGQQVKRSAPGGEGWVLDHFSKDALKDYLEPYEKALGPAQNKLRALFNDSYEVYGANYTPRLFEEFNTRRGYDLSEHLPKLVAVGSGGDPSLILSDYRETLSDLLLEDFSHSWNKWSREQTFKTKYQAHGCPANLLDIYATADIPECESFYATQFDIPGVRWEESDANKAQPDLIMLKFASSAAHISGKQLTSSETFTWLREHFKTALSQCKPEVEQIFLSGVNHSFFHGSTYFPDESAWPGWKFYASVNFVPTSTLWRDAPFMFEYITRCQSMLQSGKSDNEILVYWPFHDVIAEDYSGELLMQLGIHNKDEWLVPSSFYQTVNTLIEQGYSVDFISDLYLTKAFSEKGKIHVSGTEYHALVVPQCEKMTIKSFDFLSELAGSGANVVFTGLPESVPGYHMHQERTTQLQEKIQMVRKELDISTEVLETLAEMGIQGEALKKEGLDFVRRDLEDGKIYYLVNHTPHIIDGYIPLNYQPESVMILDPLTGNTGLGAMKPKEKESEVYLHMKPGVSLILRTFDRAHQAAAWEYHEVKGAPVEPGGTWDLQFLSGGPELPESIQLEKLHSWTDFTPRTEAFSGT
ncbi:MAG: glycoside hydrolase, partial [Bacteroidetes bacterium]|nr:glycoside hydrolase [Bacteroidota bacterium]